MKANILSSAFWIVLLVCGSFGQDRSSTAVTINGKRLSIDYGRPSLKGRDMLGQVTSGTVWRLGSNKATEISSMGDLVVGDKVLKAGKYSLWAKKTDNGWLLMFHPRTGISGEPVLTDGFVAQMPLRQTSSGSSAEELTITLSNDKGKAEIKVEWGTAVLTGSFGVCPCYPFC